MIPDLKDVSRENLNKLEKYVDFLLKWNQKINLISKKTVPEVWERHILDSMRLAHYIKPGEMVLDLGSGAGLPGVVLSIMGLKSVALVESDQRKSSFLIEARRVLGLGFEVFPTRVEKLNVEADVVVARGFAELKDILGLAQNIKCQRYLLLKGGKVMNEIKEAKELWGFEYKIHGDKSGSCILEVKKNESGH